jgi:8-oxo-dGTP pyrophosphatase MutT (NUDIX family)
MDRPRQTDGRVHGVIIGCRRNDRWLLIRRSDHVAAAGKICFPGGAIEPGEDPAEAARREMLEELGAEVHILRRVWRHDFSDQPLTLWGYLGRLLNAALTPDDHEVSEIVWLTPQQVCAHPDAMPRTAEFLDALCRADPGP